jgi:hypothetical protein
VTADAETRFCRDFLIRDFSFGIVERIRAAVLQEGMLRQRDAVEMSANVFELVSAKKGSDDGLNVSVDGFGSADSTGNLRQAVATQDGNNERLLPEYENHRIACCVPARAANVRAQINATLTISGNLPSAPRDSHLLSVVG